jgi:excisionase family DNA binding protein
MQTRSTALQQAEPLETSTNGSGPEVLTLGEAAAYLRLPESEVLCLVREQGLPARQIGAEWRILKASIQAWLGLPLAQGHREGVWAAAGSLKEDPYRDELLREVYRRRGRPMTEAG